MQIFEQPTKEALAGQDLIYDAFTNDGIIGLPESDAPVAQLEFGDIFNLDNAVKELDAADLMSTKDLTRMIGDTISRIVQEAVEPDMLVIPNLFEEVRFTGNGRSIEIGSLGAFHAGEVAEGGEYPEVDFNYGEGDMVAVGISKHGLKMRVTEEVIEDNLFDVFGMFLRMAGRALARHKESHGIQLINEYGYELYDNADSANSLLGATTGRGIDGAQNGTMSVEDIFEMYIWLYMRGFAPDTLMINPLAWRMFMSDPETREIILKGATLASKRLPNGSGANLGTTHGGMGLRVGNTGYGLNNSTKVSGGNPWTTTLNPIGATWEISPKYLPTPLKVIVTPYLQYATGTVASQTKPITSVVMADSSRCGLLLTKDGVSMDEWDDPERDIKAMKLKERWGMAVFEQGKGIAVARNVVVDKNYVFENVNQKALSVIDTTPTPEIVT